MTRVSIPKQAEGTDRAPLPRTHEDDSGRLALGRLTVARPAALRRWAIIAAATVVAAGLGALVAWAPWQAPPPAGPASTPAAQARDEALQTATDALLAFNTIDHERMDETIQHWLEVSGGELHQDVRHDRAAIRARAVRTAADTSASVIETAISSFDDAAGRATVLGVLEVRTQPAHGKATRREVRFRVLVQHIGSNWKVTFLEALEVPS